MEKEQMVKNPVNFNVKTINVDDFTCPCTGLNAINIDAQDGLTIEEVGLPPGGLNSFPCLAIKGKLSVINDYLITNGEIRMQPGSEIIIEQNAELTIGYTDNYGGIYGCQQMWKGITVTDGATLKFYRNTIKDAQYAITVEPNATLGIMYRNRFENNHIGIYSPPALQIYPVHITYPLRRNTFIGTSDLLAAYDEDLPNYQTSRPYAGIEINTAKFDVGSSNPVNINYFEYLRNGIIASSSYLTVTNAQFTEIVSTPSLGGAAFGIILRNKSRGKIFKNYFIGHDRAIDVNQSDAIIRSNTMEIVFFGIYIEDGNGHCFSIVNNNISFGAYAIIGFYAEYPNLFHIKFNKMYGLEHSHLPHPRGAAIVILGENVPTNTIVGYYTRKQIIGNKMELLDNYSGVVLNGDGNWNISSNTDITFTGSQNLEDFSSSSFIFLAGIVTISSHNNYIYGNAVTSEEQSDHFLNNKQKSYANLFSKNIRYCCNSSSNTLTGFDFTGPCKGTRIKHSIIGHHRFYGMLLRQGTVFNTGQFHGENRWLLNSSDYPEGAGASHFGSPEEIQSSKFYIQNVSSGSPDADLWPPSWETPNSPNADWLTLFPGNYQTCADDVIHCFHPLNTVAVIEEEDIKTTRSLYTGVYGNMLNWETSKALYSKLKNNPSLIGQNAEIDLFFTLSQNSAIAPLYDVQKSFETLYEPTTSQLIEIENARNAMDDIWVQINIIDSLYEFALSQNDSLDLESQKKLLDQAFVLSATDWENVMSEVKEAQLSAIGNILAINQTIVATTMFESDEKLVNRIYLTTVASGVFTLDSLQFDLIKNIAEKCPLLDGSVVYRARVLYQLNEDRVFEDANCPPLSLQRAQDNGTYKTAAQKKEGAKTLTTSLLFPNPANKEIIIDLSGNNKETVIGLQIKSIEGRIVKQMSIFENTSFVKVDISNLPEGIYFCEIQYRHSIENIGKFVKIN